MFAFGTADLIEAMASFALDSVRAARYIWAGLCFASWSTVSLPRPVFAKTGKVSVR